jgi:hypothetical protein
MTEEKKKEVITTAEIRDREKSAFHDTCKAHKEHYERAGQHKTGEQIEREVRKMQEDIAKKKDHEIYKGR